MRLSTATVLALVVLLAAASVGAVAAVPSATASDTSGQPSLGDDGPATSSSLSSSTSPPAATSATTNASLLERPDPYQVIRIDVASNGDARWIAESRFVISDDEEEAAFRDYADAVESGDRDALLDDDLVDEFEQRAAQASDDTDREMSIQDVGWEEATVEEDDDDDVRIGVVAQSFVWTNFAEVDGEYIHLGDAFQTDDGSWLSLYDGQRLVVEWPSDYALDTATTDSWDGPHHFEEGDLEMTFVHGNSSPPDLLMIAGVAVFLIAVGAGSYHLSSRVQAIRLPFGLGADSSDDESTTADAAAEVEEPAADPGPGDSAAAARAGVADGETLSFDESVDDDVDPELLSDEERVHRLLRQNGGRMKQASIVDETGWSNAKVSQLLSRMDDDEEIEKLRIGRENLITLPEVDPTEID